MIVSGGVDRLVCILFDWQPEKIFESIDASTRVKPAVQHEQGDVEPGDLTCGWDSVSDISIIGKLTYPH